MGERKAVRDAAGGVGRNGRGFGGDDPPVNAADQIGEGSADINANNVHAIGPVMPRQRVRPLAGPMTSSGGASSSHKPCIGSLRDITPCGCLLDRPLSRTMTAEGVGTLSPAPVRFNCVRS